jgi:hypothetical protein
MCARGFLLTDFQQSDSDCLALSIDSASSGKILNVLRSNRNKFSLLLQSRKCGREHFGIVRRFHNLTYIHLAQVREQFVGIIVARGSISHEYSGEPSTNGTRR